MHDRDGGMQAAGRRCQGEYTLPVPHCAEGQQCLACYGRQLRESSEMRPTNLEWGYPPRRTTFIRGVRTVLIATAVGASFGGIVVLLFFAPAIERKTLTEERQLSQSASTPTLRLNRTPTDLESAKPAGIGGQLAGVAATGSTRSSTLAVPSRPITAEQRTVTDHRPGEPVAIAAETAAQATKFVETNATKRPHIAISETRSGYRGYGSVNTTCASETPVRAMPTVVGSALIRMPIGVMAAGTDWSETRE
jgi:hypothetical protein